MKTATLTADQLVEVMRVFLSSAREMLTEIKAHEMTHEILRQLSLGQPALAEAVQILDVTLAASRSSALQQEKMRLKFDGLLETWRQLVDQAQTAEEVLEAFEKLTKTKWLN